MKRFFLMCAIGLMTSVTAFSQETNTAVVVLKNGTTIMGTVKQFNPTSNIVVNVGGFDTTIKMSDVASVNNVATTKSPLNNIIANNNTAAEETLNLPTDTTINICGKNVKFVLMRGGTFQYGFNGRGSLSMDSEPVHEVHLSPFYVSEEFVSRDLYQAVTKTAYPDNFDLHYRDKKTVDEDAKACALFYASSLKKPGLMNSKWQKITLPSLEDFLKSLHESNKDLDVPTEIQWFYQESKMSKECSELKTPAWFFCQFAWMVSMEETNDPVGQALVVKGSTKNYSKGRFEKYRLYDRSATKMTNITNNYGFTIEPEVNAFGNVPVCPIRLVIPAKK